MIKKSQAAKSDAHLCLIYFLQSGCQQLSTCCLHRVNIRWLLVQPGLLAFAAVTRTCSRLRCCCWCCLSAICSLQRVAGGQDSYRHSNKSFAALFCKNRVLKADMYKPCNTAASAPEHQCFRPFLLVLLLHRPFAYASLFLCCLSHALRRTLLSQRQVFSDR